MNHNRDTNAPKHKAELLDVSEEDLNAFLDGELDQKRNAQVAALVEQDTDLQKRLVEMEQLNKQLKAFGQNDADETLPPRIRTLVNSWLKRG